MARGPARPADRAWWVASDRAWWIENDRAWWVAAFGCVALAVPLRLALFAGYGLGDDPNFIAAAIDFLEYGRLDLSNPYHLRPLFVLPQALSFHLLGIDDFSLVLPTFVAAIGTHALGVTLAGAAFGARGACFVSLLWLTTPFESLTATAAVPDHGLALFLTAAAGCCWRGRRSAAAGWMVAGAALVLCGVAVKLPALGILPSFALATALAGPHWRRWLPFWATLALAAALGALAFLTVAADARGWLARILEMAWPDPGLRKLAAYPRLLLLRDDHHHFMFGAAGWLAIAGVLAAAWRRPGGARPRGASLVLLSGSYLAVFLFLAGAVEFPRVFRYLAQVAPALYLCGGFFVAQLYARSRTAALAVLGLAAAFGLQQTLPVTEPSRDPNRDGRVLTAFLAAERIAPGVVIQGDFWTCARIRWLLDPASRDWRFHCPTLRKRNEKRAFLEGLESGYLITGGGTLAWYTTGKWTLALDETRFSPPPPGGVGVGWELLLEHDGPRRAWRREPLRVWRVVHPELERVVEVPDPSLRRCLHRAVFPDDTAEDPERPITVVLAREPRRLHCARAGIRDARGLEAFVNARELILSHNELERLDLGGLSQLRVALLNGNRLEQVTGLEHAPELEQLWLSHNALRSIALGALPALRDLRLEHNALARIRTEASLPRLSTLALWANPALDCPRLPFPAALVARSGCGGAGGDLAARLPALDAGAHNERAWLLGAFGHPEDLEEARAHVAASLALEPSAHGYDTLGRFRERGGDLEGAVEAYDRALALDPGYFPAYQSRGDARLALGDRAGALRDYRRWVSLAPSPDERALAEEALGRVEAED